MSKNRRESTTSIHSRYELGPGGLMFFVVSVLILAVAIYSQAPLLFWAFGLMVGALIVSIFLSAMMLRHLSVQRIKPTHGVARESMLLRYQLFNPKRIIPAFGVVITETWGKGRQGWRKTGPVAATPARLKGRPLGWVVHVGPGQHIQAESPCWPLRRGYLTLEKIEVSTAFPFGILRRVRVFEAPGQVLVYPRLVRIDRQILFKLSDMDPFGRERIDRGGGHEEFYGLREYRPGDSMKTIDWKRTARTGQLVSREMTQPSPPKIMVALDLSDPALHIQIDKPSGKKSGHPDQLENHDHQIDQHIEQAISLTASLVCDAYFHGYQIGLAVMGVPFTPFPVHHSLPHRTKMLEALSQLDASHRTGGAKHLPSRPSIIIRPRVNKDAPDTAGQGQQIFDAAKIQDYAVDLQDGAGDMLEGRSASRSRRQQVQEERAWG
jgi:uncharacterized protein (DUF58 family)